ncbi:unnamed protein product [Hermetia illucens]|uniref:Uncharacterized protein n=1 Tax=Hermetia illucens TaxID=343691 RepID=A0A7R8Z1K5_HERIL|nr:unnamed protein product [Hermetia illucens]
MYPAPARHPAAALVGPLSGAGVAINQHLSGGSTRAGSLPAALPSGVGSCIGLGRLVRSFILGVMTAA